MSDETKLWHQAHRWAVLTSQTTSTSAGRTGPGQVRQLGTDRSSGALARSGEVIDDPYV